MCVCVCLCGCACACKSESGSYMSGTSLYTQTTYRIGLRVSISHIRIYRIKGLWTKILLTTIKHHIFTCKRTFRFTSGPDPGRCNRCKCIGQKKIADAFIGQIFTANNKKQHFLRKHKAYNLQNATKVLFPRNDHDTYSEFTPERFVFPKTCPRTITLTFPPLIHTAMFQYLLFNDVNIVYYVFESACIKCVYAITHMSDYPLYVKYNQLRSQNYLPIHVFREN